MPYIHTVTNLPLSPEQERSLKASFGAAMPLLDKSEQWLMLRFEGGCPMWFSGSDAPAALAEISLYGGASREQYDAATARLTELLSKELSLDPRRIYICYHDTPHWGWNGVNL